VSNRVATGVAIAHLFKNEPFASHKEPDQIPPLDNLVGEVIVTKELSIVVARNFEAGAGEFKFPL